MYQEDDRFLALMGLLFFVFATIAVCMGCRGKQGAPGVSGEPGGQGPTGQVGAAGVDGTNGTNGENGQNGATGTVGPQGPAGAGAQPCSVSEISGGAAVTCDGKTVVVNNGAPGASGPAGPSGAMGADGTAGVSGLPGPAGPSGAAAISQTAVRLCADSTSAFPEYGLRIGNALYAVYWGPLNGDSTSQAFLAHLAPGEYESTNGTGCLFTVNADGSITN